MMIGPDPRTRIFWMSLRLGNQLEEAVEEVHGIVRARPSLGVVLDGGARHVLQDETFHRAAVQVDVAEPRSAEVGLPSDRLVDFHRSPAPRAPPPATAVPRGDVYPAARLRLAAAVRSP